MADEELLPDAVARAVACLESRPELGAVYGDAQLTDLEGRATGTWIARPWDFQGYLCREVDPPFVASFFRRNALAEAGLFTRDWVYGIGEFELWVRLGLVRPILYLPGVMGRYAVHPLSSSSVGFQDSERFVRDRSAFFQSFFAEPDLPEAVRAMAPRAQAGLHLFMAEVLAGLKAYPEARAQVLEAMAHRPNGERVLELARKLARAELEWDGAMLRHHIAAHLAQQSPRRVVCYGAGNDFGELMGSGLFAGHTVVAVVDNGRSAGSLVAGVPVIGEADLARTGHDLLVVTSSQWANELRASALRRALVEGRQVPVI
jgi:hypothetical protein